VDILRPRTVSRGESVGRPAPVPRRSRPIHRASCATSRAAAARLDRWSGSAFGPAPTKQVEQLLGWVEPVFPAVMSAYSGTAYRDAWHRRVVRRLDEDNRRTPAWHVRASPCSRCCSCSTASA
jgi:hypothetical protein